MALNNPFRIFSASQRDRSLLTLTLLPSHQTQPASSFHSEIDSISESIDEMPNASFYSARDRGRRKSWYSFGDNGLTATVGASGQLLRITRHFPGERTGFCVDEPDMKGPFFMTSRLQQFMSRATDPSFNLGIGPSVDLLHSTPDIYYSAMIHDRWPAFTMGAKNVKLDLNYIVLDGTVYQTFKFDYSRDNRSLWKESPLPLPTLRLRSDLLIRNQNFMSPPAQNSFNDAKHVGYKPSRLEGDYLVREHEAKDGKKALLCIAAFNEGEFFKFSKCPGPPSGEEGYEYFVEWDDATSESFVQSGVLSVTVAYKLEYGTPLLEISPKLLDELDKSKDSYEAEIFSDEPDLDFCLRRNLEHILSVCSIPVFPNSSEGEATIALTCGDIDGHLVSTVASFYSFQILLQGLEHFKSRYDRLIGFRHQEKPEIALLAVSSKMSYVHGMIERIRLVCRGHIRWLLQMANTDGRLFCAYYWINGEEIKWEQNGSFLPRMSLVDTPFQIIKIRDYLKISEDNFGNEVIVALQHVVESWIKEINDLKKDTPGLYAIPRYDSELTKSFYLTDHALIWQAMKSAEDIGLQLPASLECSPKRIQESILRMFATTNPFAQQRLLAVKRGPAQTRFTFRYKDIALFRAAEMGLFNEPTHLNTQYTTQHGRGIWEKTIEFQVHNYTNDTSNQIDPRRFASFMAISMAHSGFKNPVPTAPNPGFSALLGCSLANGLFPGELDEEYRFVLSYKDELSRVDYWGTTFEIPYLLWKYAPPPKFDSGFNRKQSNFQQRRLNPGVNTWRENTETHHPASFSIGQMATGNMIDPGRQARHYSKKAPYIPINNLLSQKNIRELQDEWLYNRPTFFVSSAEISVHRQAYEGQLADEDPFRYQMITGVLVDVPGVRPLETKIMGHKIPMQILQSREAVQAIVDKGRTADDAKKRLWAFFSSSPTENEVSTSTVSLSLKECDEKQEMRRFYQRHRSYANFFADETKAILNTWTTEMHLSFYTVVDTEGNDSPLLDDTLQMDSFYVAFSNVAKQHLDNFAIGRCSMGFRFHGDFFDRYWTCSYLESDPLHTDNHRWQTEEQSRAETELRDLLEGRFKHVEATEVEKNSWQQRRILELVLFERIMKRMDKSTREFLDWVKTVLAKSRKSLQTTLDRTRAFGDQGDHVKELQTALNRTNDSENQRLHLKQLQATLKEFRKFRKDIQRMGRHYAESITKLERASLDGWDERERSRAKQRPRWTLKDEIRYRVIIQELVASNDDIVQTLRRNQEKVISLIEMELEAMSGDLEFMRAELNQRQDESIRQLTWVTTIFIPLGFAASVFSTSQAPTLQTFCYMVATAAGAFAFTGLMLWIMRELNLVQLYVKLKDWFKCITHRTNDKTADNYRKGQANLPVESSPSSTTKATGMGVLPNSTGQGFMSWRARAKTGQKDRTHDDVEASIGALVP